METDNLDGYIPVHMHLSAADEDWYWLKRVLHSG